MQNDIVKYGLYTYEDFENILTRRAYEVLNAKYFKIAVEKGLLSWDELVDLCMLLKIYNDDTQIN